MRPLLEQLLNFLAALGFTVRNDRVKVIPESARCWGLPSQGVSVSLYPLRPRFRTGESAPLDLRLRGDAPENWSYRVDAVRGEQPVPMTVFGSGFFASGKNRMAAQVEIPVDALFDLRAPGAYRLQAVCEKPGMAPAVSNPVEIERLP